MSESSHMHTPESTAEVERITSRDGASMELRVFSNLGPNLGQEPQKASDVYLLMPAMGVAAGYYDLFAASVAAAGVPVVVAENRGTGTSSVKARRGVNFGYVDMLTVDWPACIERVKARFPEARLHLLGHSLGGQLGALFLAANPGVFSSMMMVASCSVHFRGWSFPSSLRILFGPQIARLLGRTLGYFPGDRVGFGGRQARGVISDWARQGLTGDYHPRGAPIDYEQAMKEVEMPVLAISIIGDEMAPRDAVDRLVKKLSRARVQREHVMPTWALKRPSDAHFRWAREPASMAGYAVRWVQSLRSVNA